MYCSDNNICRYDGTLTNLNNFDLCLFFDIPVSSKTICLSGFDNNPPNENFELSNENFELSNENFNNQSTNLDKDQIISLITNNIINNYKTRTNYSKIVINYYSSDKNKKI